MAACLSASHAGAVDGSAFVEAFGDVSARICRAVQAHPNTISSSADPDGSIVTIEVLAVTNSDEHYTVEWDLPSNRDRHEDPIHYQAVELATYVGDCCPEVQTVEVRTLLADGSRMVISEMEPGHKRLGTAAQPSRANVRVVAGVIAAITRQVAAFSWTEIVRARTGLAQRVIELASEAPRRLNPNDNEGRRRQWAAGLDGAEEIIHGIGPPPAVSELTPGIAPAQWDPRQGRDELTQSLDEVVTALAPVVARRGPAVCGDCGMHSVCRTENRRRAERVTDVDDRGRGSSLPRTYRRTEQSARASDIGLAGPDNTERNQGLASGAFHVGGSPSRGGCESATEY